MKFKRLSDDKIQIIISSEDLEKRDVKKWDLMPNSPRAQELFQEMLEQAYEECGFEVDSETQLMVEAYPMTAESLVITVTKVRSKNNIRELLGADLDEDDDVLLDEYEDEDYSDLESNDLVYRFNDFEDTVQLANIIDMDYQDECSMYKKGNDYFLTFAIPDKLSDHALSMLGEYGCIKHIAEAYLKEHAKLMIDKNAIKVLSSLSAR